MNTRWIKGPYPYVPFKQLLKKMIRLEKKFDRATGKATKARIMKSYASCERKIKQLKGVINAR